MAKRSIWALKDADIPEKGLSKFAKSVPKVATSGDNNEDQDRDTIRRDFMTVVDGLLKNVEHIQAARGWLEGRLERAAAPSDVTESFKDASTLGKVFSDEKFLVQFLIKHTKLDKAALEKVKSYDGEAMRCMAYYVLRASPALQLPSDMQSKQIANLALAQRVADVGNLLGELKMNAGVSEAGAVDWMKVGPYKLTTTGGIISEVEYRATGTKVSPPEGVSMTTAYSIEHGHSPGKARAVNGLTKYTLHQLFGKNVGPNHSTQKPLTGKSAIMNGIVTKVVEAHNLKVQAAKQGTEAMDDVADFGAAAKKAKNEELARRAREALAKRAEEAAGKRRIKVG